MKGDLQTRDTQDIHAWEVFQRFHVAAQSQHFPLPELLIDLQILSGTNLSSPAERSVHYFWDYFSFFFFLLGHILFSQKGLSQGSETWHGVPIHQNIRIPLKKRIRGPSLPPHYTIFGQTKGGNFKSCIVVLKFCMDS